MTKIVKFVVSVCKLRKKTRVHGVKSDTLPTLGKKRAKADHSSVQKARTSASARCPTE